MKVGTVFGRHVILPVSYLENVQLFPVGKLSVWLNVPCRRTQLNHYLVFFESMGIPSFSRLPLEVWHIKIPLYSAAFHAWTKHLPIAQCWTNSPLLLKRSTVIILPYSPDRNSTSLSSCSLWWQNTSRSHYVNLIREGHPHSTLFTKSSWLIFLFFFHEAARYGELRRERHRGFAAHLSRRKQNPLEPRVGLFTRHWQNL